ncbi:MAG: hypothetical protein R6X02_19135 [Enhygromyxa sp.]
MPKIRRLASDYLLPPLDTDLNFAYRVTITKPNGKPGVYTLTLDPNSCILDDFGRTLGSTLMADFEFEISLVRLASAGDEALYQLRSRQRLPARFRLVIRHSRPCTARLLTLDQDGQITQIVHLRAAELADQSHRYG